MPGSDRGDHALALPAQIFRLGAELVAECLGQEPGIEARKVRIGPRRPAEGRSMNRSPGLGQTVEPPEQQRGGQGQAQHQAGPNFGGVVVAPMPVRLLDKKEFTPLITNPSFRVNTLTFSSNATGR